MEIKRELAYKFVAAFTDINQFKEFYMSEIGKDHRAVMRIIVAMGAKGWIVTNPDKSVSVTWYFRNFQKYNKFVNAYLEFFVVKDNYVPSKIRIDYD